MPRRNKAVTFLLMPIAAFFWCIGWSLYGASSKKETATPNQKFSTPKELIIFVPQAEHKYAT